MFVYRHLHFCVVVSLYGYLGRIIYRDLVSCRSLFCVPDSLGTSILLTALFSLSWLLQKPDNVGFDVRGDVKIFDFGLARGKCSFSARR